MPIRIPNYISIVCYYLAIAAIGVSTADSQTVELVYESTGSSSTPTPTEYFAYDFATGAAIRIDAVGNIYNITADGIGYSGKVGVASLNEASHMGYRNAKRLASIVMPQLIISDIRDDPLATLVTQTGELGGPTYTGEYPLGQRLMTREDFPEDADISYKQVFYDLDEQDRLARIRYNDTGREEVFDLAVTSTTDISHVQSFGNGAWTLVGVQIHDDSRPDLFEPTHVANLAKDGVFKLADADRDESYVSISTPADKQDMERFRSDALDEGVKGSTKSVALILTGILVIAVGSLAWWKNRS